MRPKARRRPQHADPSSPTQAEDAERDQADRRISRYDRPVQRDGTGAAGRPPGRPSGSVLDFGRHLGWSIGEIARVDPGYLVWLEGRPEGRPYLDEIDSLLRRTGFRTTTDAATAKAASRGRFGR